MQAAFFHLWHSGERVQTKGQPHYFHGHVVEEAEARSDRTRNGVFAEWTWDGSCLTVRNCRYGMSPLFYFRNGNEFCVSNSIPQLLKEGAPRDLDDDALAVFIRRRNFLGEDTAFRHIRALPPNATLTWREGRLSLEGQRVAPKARQDLKRTDIVDGVIELFGQAMSRRLPQNGEFCLPLSGGKDSRHILFELSRRDSLPKSCVTASFPPPRGNDDVRIARELAGRFAIPHIVLPPVAPDFSQAARQNAETSFCTLEHGWAGKLTDYLTCNTSVSYDGIGLDVFFNTIWYSDARMRAVVEGRFEDAAADLLGDSEPTLSAILSPEAFRRFSRERALARMVRELETHRDMPHPIASVQFWNRTRRSISTFTFALQHALPCVHTPFLDNDLFDFVTSLPAAASRGESLHKEAIARSFSDLNTIPYGSLDTTGRPSWHYTHRLSLGLARRLISKLGKSELVNNKFCIFRLLKSGVTGREADFRWIQPDLTHYLLQLEETS